MSFYCLPDPAPLLDRLRQAPRRVLLVGESGSGKSTLAAQLLDQLAHTGIDAYGLSCDPGLPAFGPPGCLALARRRERRWQVQALAPLCSLDAGRFRLPLVSATSDLLQQAPTAPLVIDTPGLVQGDSAAELLAGLAAAARPDLVIVLTPAGAPLPLAGQLRNLAPDIVQLPCAPAARPPARNERLQQRSQCWQDYLAGSEVFDLDDRDLPRSGTAPPRDDHAAWRGRQLALLHRGRLQTLAQVERASDTGLRLRGWQISNAVDQLLVRDAVCLDGKLRSARRASATPPLPAASGASEVRVELGALTSVAREPQVAVRVGQVTATLVNGVMGDPLLQVRLLHQGRSLLFDIGDTGRMPLRAAHQVSDLFISHAHADHIGGFMWLVRCRIGDFPPCRIFGPPGIAAQVQGMVSGILWDRAENRAPRFIIHEWRGDHLQRSQLIAGQNRLTPLPDQPLDDDAVILRDPAFVVRATRLDHGTPVLAYAFETRNRLQVRRERLEELGLRPGPWLQDLKHAYLRSQWQQPITPEGSNTRPVLELAQQLLLEQAGDKIAYATDFSTSADNRARLTRLARDAHTLFCEASFLLADAAQAERTRHLTTAACARIAEEARVKQLVAFHFSHRYERQREQVYRELQRFTTRLVVPRQLGSP